ncbi:MAG: Fe-S-binding ATPase [Gammaproteobacteria bacterium]|jgi:ATP-binding protein involved in chromosome partitioning|nr:Fe-S-binding ATPase [Gammaproteobacteria bacterium]
MMKNNIQMHAVATGVEPRAGVKNIIAVASGKGGVGKSTVSVNLALALQALGAQVGILDADIYGPSLPTLLNILEAPDSPDGKTLHPVMRLGLQAMSIGFLLQEKDTAMIWRGPMASTALQQLFNDCQWKDLDVLIIDLPPGTGDIQLTLAQKFPLTAAVIVTTPQDLALIDAQKAFRMFEKVSVPVLGVIENMSVHICSSCGHAEHIFGEGAAQKMHDAYGLPLLGKLPLALNIRQDCDQGEPTVAHSPGDVASLAFKTVAQNVLNALEKLPVYKTRKIPKIVVEK